MVARLGVRSLVAVPLRARAQVVGALLLVSGPSGRRYGAGDLALARDVAGRAGLAVSNAGLYDRQRRSAELLQRSLLPTVGNPPGLEVAVRYTAAVADAQVGGDWYDLMPTPAGSLVVIGDVVGHDLTAAGRAVAGDRPSGA